MSAAKGKKTTNSKKKSTKSSNRTSTNRKPSGKASTARKSSSKRKPQRKQVDYALKNEVILIAILAVAIFAFLCVINVIQGVAANMIRGCMFGLFGILAYAVPIIIFLGFAFGISNRGNTVAILKIVSAVVLLFLIGIWAYMLFRQENYVVDGKVISSLFSSSKEHQLGGGVVFGLLAHLGYRLVGMWGTLFITIVLAIISLVFISEKSFLSGMKKGSKYVWDACKDDYQRRKEYFRELEEQEEDEEEEEYVFDEKAESLHSVDKEPKLRRIDKKVKGMPPGFSVTLEPAAEKKKSDIHEITIEPEKEALTIANEEMPVKEEIHIAPNEAIANPVARSFVEESLEVEQAPVMESKRQEPDLSFMPEPVTEQTHRKSKAEAEQEQLVRDETLQKLNQVSNEEVKEVKYQFPPLSLLKKGEGHHADSAQYLKETAFRLQQTLANFGVKVTVTDISQGPTVTRYELQPELGVKVSKIVSLADDIKLNLATTDIRIEAPIPGKAAIGIEVPNKENSAVALRDLLEHKDFKQFQSNLTFAVGKDIGGQVVVTDIAKMPHLLIAGATGSGKSVCINTIIMSLLYKANPQDVKMIMIDPKVVELSVYNGIPHLMIPVVTDPKKASAALHWGVTEMTERYQKFAQYNVRDLKGYNKLAESGACDEAGIALKKMPQLVIIVDELADLMMVAASEVEESICRLAQLARAAGIHLIIATQRPSVDVITGLIKANMPSRIAFSVSSGVDSRTILDMNGAEKLLGKGDMLFYPQGYSKPARVQGAFVSDSEVSDVVDFLKNQKFENTYNAEVTEKINASAKMTGMSSSGGDGNEFDSYFAEAGRFVIEKDKASITMLQRAYKIGFNRAARIMDQLESAGVVSAEEGTKPRKILVSLEQFETILEEL